MLGEVFEWVDMVGIFLVYLEFGEVKGFRFCVRVVQVGMHVLGFKVRGVEFVDAVWCTIRVLFNGCE